MSDHQANVEFQLALRAHYDSTAAAAFTELLEYVEFLKSRDDGSRPFTRQQLAHIADLLDAAHRAILDTEECFLRGMTTHVQ